MAGLKKMNSGTLLTILTMFAVIAGVAVGVGLKSVKTTWTSREIIYIGFPGELFLRMLKVLILPLIVASIVSAIGNLNLSLCGRIGLRSVLYYATTTICAVLLGIILVSIIRPGEGVRLKQQDERGPEKSPSTVDSILDLVRNVFPDNLIQACIGQYQTINIPKNGAGLGIVNNTNGTQKENLSHEYKNGMNTVGLVMFAIVLGIAVAKMGQSGKPLLDLSTAISDAMMMITNWVIWLSPIGVTFLVAAKLLEIEDFDAVIAGLAKYFVTVLLGLIIHGFGTLSLIFWICTRELPFKYLIQMTQVMVTAFGTSSSSATLPITLQCLDGMGVDSRISKFVVPIGATINMDGTALYEAVAAIFLAQFRGISLSISGLICVSITATAASIGAAGIPQAGLVTMVMVIETLGLNSNDIVYIVAVDWLLDRFRTMINVVCDALAAIIIEKMSSKELKAMNEMQLKAENAVSYL